MPEIGEIKVFHEGLTIDHFPDRQPSNVVRRLDVMKVWDGAEWVVPKPEPSAQDYEYQRLDFGKLD